MKTLAIFGATGQTGLHLVAQALLKGGVISKGIFNFKNEPTFYFSLKKRTVIWFILVGWDQIQNIQIEDTFWDYPTFKGHNVKAIVRNEAKLKEGLEKDHDIKDHENLNIIKVIMAISVVEFQVGGIQN